MDVKITGKNMDLAPNTREYIESKLEKLTRHLPELKECLVDVNKQKTRSRQDRYVMQATLELGNTILRGESRGSELRNLVDRLEEILNRQIERYKGKAYHKGRGSSLARDMAEMEALVVNEGRITKRKRFALRPMSTGRAINNMELLGHDFYLFRNQDSDQTSLIYRRNDGNFGLIESLPEDELP